MKEYRTITKVLGPLLFLKGIEGAGLNELVEVALESGETRCGQVLEIDRDSAVVECFSGTEGIDTCTRVKFLGKPLSVHVSEDMLGCEFDGLGKPKDVKIIAEKELDINSSPINPAFRETPKEFIHTGFSSLDGLLSLVRGQKLPVFSEGGLPHIEFMCRVAENFEDGVVVIFSAIGLTEDEASYVRESFHESGAQKSTVLILNRAQDPVIERITAPRVALTIAEYFAWELQKNVVVILGDMTNYAGALRELSSAKEEVPGRMGYPPYLYSDLASIYERAGRIRESKGSITQLIFLSMPGGDITHPVPDLTGYITEGQIILSSSLYRMGIFPPVNVIPSLSRMMHKGIGKGFTREDHADLANQLYACYAEAKRIEDMKSIIGEDALSERDKKYIAFKEDFEKRFLNQSAKRSVEETLEIGWDIIRGMPKEELTRISPEFLKKYGGFE